MNTVVSCDFDVAEDGGGGGRIVSLGRLCLHQSSGGGQEQTAGAGRVEGARRICEDISRSTARVDCDGAN